MILIGAVGIAPFVTGSSSPPAGMVLLGAAAVLLGLVLVALGVRGLSTSLSVFPKPPSDSTFVTTGIYRFIRHPIYCGLIVATVGWVLVTGSLLAGVLTALLAVLLDLKSRREEAWLRDRFRGYADYARETKRLIPGLY